MFLISGRWFVLLAPALLMGIAYLLVRHSYSAAKDVRAAVLAEGHCPSCGYALKGIVPEADGCIVCAECSAAWRVKA
jgi:hypothetical protein